MSTLSWIFVVIVGSLTVGCVGYSFGYIGDFSDGVKEVKQMHLYETTKSEDDLISDEKNT